MSLIIKDEKTGTTKTFAETKEGFAKAAQEVKRINDSGHTAGGDASRVSNYTESSTGRFW